MEILDIIKEAKQVYGDKAKEVIVNEWPLEAYDGKNKARSPFNSDTTASCMWNQKELCWKDFSSGRVIGILDLFQHKYGDTYKEAIVRLCEETGVTLPDDGNWTGYNKGELLPKNYRYPYITEQSFNNRKDVEEYLGKRGLSIATLDHFGIKEDEHKNIVFEFFDADNMLLSVKLRPSHRIRPSEPKMFWQSGSDNCPLLFNVNRVNFEQPLVITEGNCFPGDAQILTKHGWVNFEDYDNEEVMQVNPDGTSSFVMPLAKIVHEYDGKMVEASQKGRYYTFTTEEHNLVLRGKNGFTKRFAKDMPDSINAECASIPVCAEYNDGKGIPLSDDEIRLFVAFSADGSYNKESCYEKRKVNRIRFVFSKKRKFDRLKTILENLGIKYTETVKPSEKYVTGTSYYIGFTDENAFLKKNFDWAWLSDMTKHQREVLLEEVCYWDGYKFDSNNIANPRNIGEYYSTIRSNAEFIQAMCHISGFMATIVYKKYSHDNHSTAMSVHMLYSKDNVSWQRMWSTGRAKKVDYKGMVYCVTVPSGMILVRQKEKISVSGNCDAMSVFEAGYHNVVSIPGGVQDTKWIEFNYKFLENFKQFIIWMDNDEAGQQGCQKIVKRLGEYNCKIVTPTDDVLDIIESYYQQYDANSHIRKADANNVLIACGGGMVLNLLKTAKEIENPKVKRLMDYDEQQLQDLPRISTGFKAIDRVMYGNFENSLTILTGKAGSGKSTLLNQFFIAEPLEAGERVLIYSGELPARILLGNILRPLASRRHIIELDNGEDQPKGYKVTTEASKAIKSYYRDSLFVFDDLDELETNGGGLLEAMEYSYKRYGITSYVIDNLMTVDMRGVQGESKMDCQIQFVKRLKKFTREYPVKVLLVAHARKLASGQSDVGLDDISGASEIVKLCDRCYDIRPINNGDDADTLSPSTKISVVKDRQAGRVGAKFELYFDECSSRIYTDEPERDKQYAWERDLWRQKKEIQYPEVIKNHIVANLPDRVVPVKVETADGEKPDDMPF